MKIAYSDTSKLCHMRPGEVVRNPLNGRLCMIVKVDGYDTTELKSAGLYNEKAPLFLVDLETGILVQMPHLSSKVANVEAVLQVL